MYKNIFYLSLAIVVFYPQLMFSYHSFPSYVPYGEKFGCQMCHAGGSFSIRNSFGQTVGKNLKNGVPDWSKIFKEDSDGDGFTNGVELQDPDGDWEPGDDPPGNEELVSKPWDVNSTPSPNSVEFINDVSSLNIRFSDSGKLSVNFDSKFSSNALLRVFNLSGNILSESSRFIKEGENNFSLNISDQKLSAAMYFLIIENDKYYLREKFIYTE